MMLVGMVCICAAAAPIDEWYSITLAGLPAGWSHVVESVEGDIRTVHADETMTIGRANVEVTVRASTQWKDHLDGRPISMQWMQEMGGPPIRTTWQFEGDIVIVTSDQGGRVNRTEQPAPTVPWLTPAATRELLEQRAAAGASEVTWRTMVPDLGLMPAVQVLTRIGDGTVTVQGRSLSVSKWQVQTEGLPVRMETWFSKDWRPVMTMMQAPFGEIRSQLTDEATATHQSGGPAPELFMSLFIEPTGTLGSQLTASRAFMRLRTRDGRPLDLPASGGQTIAGVRGDAVLLLVERDGSLLAAEDERDAPAFQVASTMIDSDDLQIQALAATATATLDADASAAMRAEAARDTVFRWITNKGLATAFASASETVRERAGDCSEHGVLLAAVLRAQGIPSRVASGLVWMDRIESFGWHMWTQALIDGAWVDLDATLPVPFTVGHILVATSALEDGDGQRQLMALLGLLGNLDIEIVRVDR
jgi:hypothetical protein